MRLLALLTTTLALTACANSPFGPPTPVLQQGTLTTTFSAATNTNFGVPTFTPTSIVGYYASGGTSLSFKANSPNGIVQTLALTLLGKVVQGQTYSLDPAQFGNLNTANLVYSESTPDTPVATPLKIWYVSGGSLTVTTFANMVIDLTIDKATMTSTPRSGSSSSTAALGSFTLDAKGHLTNVTGI